MRGEMGPILGRTTRPLSEFPAELLIMIAKCLLCQPCETYSATTLHKSGQYECLQALALVSKSLRHACIAAGIFNRIQPRPSHSCFYHFLLRSTRLSSLTVDIGEPQLWSACANIMKIFPKLEELGLTGSATQKSAKELCNSSLGEAFQQFRGSSLVLKKADPTLRILLKIHRANITKLYLNQCEFQVTLSENELQTIVKRQDDLRTPLCPNVQVISFVYSRNNPLRLEPRAIVGFVDLFLKYAENIQHVGITYGSRPRLFKDRETLWGNKGQLEELSLIPNRSYNLCREYILSALQQYSRNSLVSFTEYDGLNGPFMEDAGWWFEPHEGPFPATLPPFTAIKLLAFRCHDLNLLTSYDGIDDCTAGYRWHLPDKNVEFRKENQYHSIWVHIINLAYLFRRCDCIFIESESLPDDFILDKDFRELASLWLAPTVCYYDYFSDVRYVIVGNYNKEICGLEYEMTINDNIHDDYWISLDDKQCRKILKERMYE